MTCRAAAADVPAAYKDKPWSRLGVDVDHDFEPLYVVSPDKKAKVTELKSLLKDADELYLATDPDREGEAIAWRLLQTLKPRVPVRRMVFHEITEPAIRAAADGPRELDDDLVDAQETRRILDRLYGYEVSRCCGRRSCRSCRRAGCSRSRPGSWCRAGGSAWRSVASILGHLRTLDGAGRRAVQAAHLAASLQLVSRRLPVATGRDFGSQDGGQLKSSTVTVLDEAGAAAEPLRRGAHLAVSSAEPSRIPASRTRRS